MNESLTQLASAYLDGDVTDDERAQVGTDPSLLAEVERLRAVRLLLGNVEPPKISVREAHLAAAFDVWDRLPDAERTGQRRDATPTGMATADAAGSAAMRAPAALGRRGQRASTRWLTGAAAALVLVLAGGVALQLANTDDSSDAGGSEATDALDSAPSADAAESGDDAIDVGELEAATAADGTVRLDTDVDAPPPPREEELLQQLLSADDLADFAAPALGASEAPDVPAATSAPVSEDLDESSAVTELPLCLGADIVVGPALYDGVLVVVGIDEGRNLALAYQPESCNEIARVQLVEP